jgi:hypothetical protein
MGEAVDLFRTSPPHHHSGGCPMHPQLRILRAQSTQFHPLRFAQRCVRAASFLTCLAHPIPERARVDSQVSGDLRDRLAGLGPRGTMERSVTLRDCRRSA